MHAAGYHRGAAATPSESRSHCHRTSLCRKVPNCVPNCLQPHEAIHFDNCWCSLCRPMRVNALV